MNLQRLAEPFPPNEIHWRIGQSGEKNGEIWAKVLAYLDARAVMDRLDEVCGPENWRNEFRPLNGTGNGNLCGVSIKIGDEWITKWDGAENTDIEATKGGLSDSFKRAAVHWGIGRYLYNLGEGWADISDKGTFSAKTKDGKWFKWDAPKLPAHALPAGHKPDNQKQNEKPAEKPKNTAPKNTKPTGQKTIESVPEEFREYCLSAVETIKTANSVKELGALWMSGPGKKPQPVQDYLLPLFTARKKEVEPDGVAA